LRLLSARRLTSPLRLGFDTRKTRPGSASRPFVVRSTLKQEGFAFGSGCDCRTSRPGKGLVKLVFRHGDGRTSVVELVR
jgi:hypothetical protein